MSFELESQRLENNYHAALTRNEESVAFWRTNPIAYAVGPGERVPVTTIDVLLEADRRGMPDETCREAMAALDEWRAFRAAHGTP